MKSILIDGHQYIKLVTFILLVLSIQYTDAAVLKTNLYGKVLDGETHEPIENGIVLITELNLTAKTDSLGQFVFREVNEGRYNLKINLIGYMPVEEKIIIDKESNKNLLIHLFPIALHSETIVITGEHPTSTFDDLQEVAHVLKDKNLQRDLGLSLAATLKNETGLSVRSMGPAPARPVIRGLGGDRVAITEDGINIRDLSSTSPDHAVTVEPFTAERIEVIRGPKILCKTSTTLGGVVNVIHEEIPTKIPSSITGNAGLFGESANKGLMGSLVTEIPLYNFVFRGEISDKKASDLKTPVGTLKNSDLNTFNYSSGLSFVGNWGYSGISFRNFDSDYGVPGGFVGAHPFGVDINMFKRQLNGKLFLNFPGNKPKSLELDLNRIYYRHKEMEANGLIGAEFAIHDYSGTAKFNHTSLGLLEEGTIGLSLETRDFNVGGYVFTPKSKSLSFSTFAFETFHIDQINFQFALRYNYDKINPEIENPDSKIGYIRNRYFNTYSLSFSAVYEILSDLNIGTNISKSSRVPTIEELFSEGPHLAAYSYETGNPDLKDESGIGAELFVYLKKQSFYGLVTAYHNILSYYIIPRNTGKINYSTLLPVYASSGVEATISGLETEAEVHFLDNCKINASLIYTFGKIDKSNTPLPAIPPMKGMINLQYSQSNFTFGIGGEFAGKQNRVDQFEQPTAGYFIWNSFAQYIFITGNYVHNISLNAENILDSEYRNHLSRVKSILPEAGRNFRMIYRIFF